MGFLEICLCHLHPAPATTTEMDMKGLRCLSNSISRFIHLVSCGSMNNMPGQKDYREIANSLKLLKPILDDVADAKEPLQEITCKEYEELDVFVNEAREFIESWCPNMSKICGVVRSRRLVQNIQGYSLEICHIICRSPSTSSSAEIQQCMQEFQSLKLDISSEYIEEALKCLREGAIPHSEILIKVTELLSLTSRQELLKESIAVEKEKLKAKINIENGESDQINQIVDLISHIRDTMVKLESFKAINGVLIPSYFRCPLSLELMLDPVIVATGQTYEKEAIQKWLDHGLTICPVTRQKLSHSNLIPNYTVRALIASWCEENKIKFTKASDSKSEDQSSQDLIHIDKFNRSLHSSSSTSRSSLDVRNGCEAQNVDTSPRVSEVSSVCQTRDDEKFYQSSPEQSYSHSRSGSTSTAVSSNDYLPTVSGEIKGSAFSPLATGKQYHSSNQIGEMVVANGSRNYPRTLSLPPESGSNDLTTTSHVEKLVKDLKSGSNEAQTEASAELRFLAKHNMENRIIIGQCGAIQPLLSLLQSNVKQTQEHAVTALLNLSINGNIKSMIAEAGAIEPLIHVLKTGNSGAKENAAAALFSLSVLEEYRVKIGRSGAVKALVDLLGSGTLRGKKDAATALFNLSIFHENKARIIQAGAMKQLVKLLDPATEMVDKAVALLANLSTVTEGCLGIAREGGIPLLVEVIETGSQRGKENAASVLLQLCLSSPKYCRLVLQEGAVPPLVALSQSGTPRAKEKAQQLLSHFRNQRENSMGRGKS